MVIRFVEKFGFVFGVFLLGPTLLILSIHLLLNAGSSYWILTLLAGIFTALAPLVYKRQAKGDSIKGPAADSRLTRIFILIYILLCLAGFLAALLVSSIFLFFHLDTSGR